MRISYNDIKKNKKKNKSVYYNIYRKFSTPFTYVFVSLGMTPSAVSILNFFPSLLGYFFLSRGTYLSIIIGLLFFILYKIVDCCDGEVARLQNPKAMEPMHKKVEGVYFDAVGHFIEPICLGTGLGVGLYRLYGDSTYITIGVALAILFTLEFALSELVRSYFRKGLIERKIVLKEDLKTIQNSLNAKFDEGISWNEQNILVKLFGVYPSQGLIFSKEFIALILLVLTALEYFLIKYFGIPWIIYGHAIGILSVYVVVNAIVKLIKVSAFILKLKNREYITKFLSDMR